MSLPPEFQCRARGFRAGPYCDFGRYGLWWLPALKAVSWPTVPPGGGLYFQVVFAVNGRVDKAVFDALNAISHTTNSDDQARLFGWLLSYLIQRNYDLTGDQIVELVRAGDEVTPLGEQVMNLVRVVYGDAISHACRLGQGLLDQSRAGCLSN